MNRRRPVPSARASTFPALVAFVAACTQNATTGDPPRTTNPPPPPPPPPPFAADAGVAPFEPVVIIPPDHPMPLAGAPMMVTPHPPPAPALAPAPAPPPASAPAPRHRAPAPAAAAPAPPPAPPHPLLAGRAPGLYLVHDHPQGTPCRPVSQTEVDALRQQLTPR